MISRRSSIARLPFCWPTWRTVNTLRSTIREGLARPRQGRATFRRRRGGKCGSVMGGQCAFVGAAGRCTERGFLEFHHVKPYADGGRTVVENLELRCRAHYIYEAEQYFGCRLPLLRERRDVAYCVQLGPDRVEPSERTALRAILRRKCDVSSSDKAERGRHRIGIRSVTAAAASSSWL